MILRFFDNPTVLIISAIVMIMALIFHNIVQAWVASRYGDHSPKLNGFMNFDPQQHLEPFGVLFLFLLGFGWPKTITVNSRNYRGRGRQEALVWYSGPLAYLVVAFVTYLIAALVSNTGERDVATAFLVTGDVAILHAVINLFPVFPLDGARAALAWGNPEVRRVIGEIAKFGILGFVLVFFVLSAIGVTSAIMLFFRGLLFGLLRALGL
ncbi:MAG: site-2 protease family protein [Trueperaceae bacterium]|nr:MAG: site-2 protease family protein [Trueperaceae bacterium]